MPGEQRSPFPRGPLLAVSAGTILLVAALVGGFALHRHASNPPPIGSGTATALAGQTPSTAVSTPATTPASTPVSSSASPLPTTSASAPATRVPQRVQISALDIDSPVVPVGVDAQGDMAIPEDVSTLGWYQYGPGPGASQGSIVVVGHVDSAAQGEGAFFDLKTIASGTTVVVTTTDGHVWRYRVVGRQFYPKTSVPLPALFSTTGAPRLTLITCGGQFDPTAHSYLDNVVVTAVPA